MLLATSAPVVAQSNAAPVMAVMPAVAQPMLPANTEVAVTPNDDLTSATLKEGDSFKISTVYDVMYNGYVVIPRGTGGQAKLTYRTGKGAFGKSAKMEIEYEWLDLNGRRIALSGKHMQAGQGNAGAAVGAVIAVGVFGAFVTGKSARIPHGQQLAAHTAEPLPISIPAGATPVPTATVLPASGASQTTVPSAPPTAK